MTKKYFIVILTSVIKRFGKTLRELIYPRYCLLCRNKIVAGKIEDLVCTFCLKAIRLNTPPFCQKCGRQIKGKYLTRNICKNCRHTYYYFDRAWASCSYEGSVKEMIHNFKYKDKIHLKKPLSRLIVDFIKLYSLPVEHCDYIAPIPLSPSRLREREFNQAEILAEGLSEYFEVNILRDNLSRIRNTASQTGLDKEKRLMNIEGAFKLKNPEAVKGKNILLIDDVLTTGVTASEAAKTLKEAQAGVVFVLAVAN